MPTERFFGPRPSAPFLCLPDLLEHQASRIPDAPAILAPGRSPLTYRRLHRHVESMGRTLRTMGSMAGVVKKYMSDLIGFRKRESHAL